MVSSAGEVSMKSGRSNGIEMIMMMVGGSSDKGVLFGKYFVPVPMKRS
jgi:hypothetical protein